MKTEGQSYISSIEERRGSEQAACPDIAEAVHEMSQSALNEVAELNRQMEEEINLSMQRAREEFERLNALATDRSVKNQRLLREIRSSQSLLAKMRRHMKTIIINVLPWIFLGYLQMRETNPEDLKFNQKDSATEQLKKEGITKERKAAYIPGVSEVIHRSFAPFAYQSRWHMFSNLPKNIITGRKEMHIRSFNDIEDSGAIARKADNPDREDAWAFYLGLPQQHDTFGVSEFKPEHSRNDQYYYKLNNWLAEFSQRYSGHNQPNFKPIKAVLEEIEIAKQEQKAILESDQQLLNDPKRTPPDKKEVWQKALDKEKKLLDQNRVNLIDQSYPPHSSPKTIMEHYAQSHDQEEVEEEIRSLGIMGVFTLSRGQDSRGPYISYYDRWDLSRTQLEGEKGLFGKPFEIYDRIYYDPQTYEALPSPTQDSK